MVRVAPVAARRIWNRSCPRLPRIRARLAADNKLRLGWAAVALPECAERREPAAAKTDYAA